MHKVRFITPKLIDLEKNGSTDPRDYIPVELEGYAVDDAALASLAAVKTPRGYWRVYDVTSGRFLNQCDYSTRKSAIESFDDWAVKLAKFARENDKIYRGLCQLADTLAHEMEQIRYKGE